ncbi:hypothetical protein F4776DRAFT_676386 [Hypoxylon sp. NC0597]|nr:hypothetical protein F4776DRAFT_676386 [Hypoxylon sp. NC0597]
MKIANRSRIQYLWIDRLCIFQDSAEDWCEEASRVQEVYQNASFCISALSAEDDEGGCFFSRTPEEVAPTAVTLSCMEEPFRADLEDTAWRIHFGKKQVFWECSEVHACETHPEGFGIFEPVIGSSLTKPDKQNGADLGLWKQLISTPIIPHTTTDPRIQLLVNWSATMSLYSSTQLTIPSDKLVAVSGLAKYVRKGLQSVRPGEYQYLAGFWKDMLIETLAWYVRVGAPANRAIRYRAPS